MGNSLIEPLLIMATDIVGGRGASLFYPAPLIILIYTIHADI